MITVSDVISLIENAVKLGKKIKDKELNDVLLQLQMAVIQFGSQNLELQEKYAELKKYVEIPDDIYLDDDGFICRKK